MKTFQKNAPQAVNFAKFFAKTTACLAFITSAYANTPDEKSLVAPAVENQVEQCSYFYEFNFSDPQLRKLEIRRAIRSMFFSVRIQKENAQLSRHILPKKMQDEDDQDYWFPVVVEQQLSNAGVRSDKPLHLTLTHEDHPDDSAIGGHILRALSQTDLIRVEQNMVSEQEREELYQKRDYQLIHSEFCTTSQDPVQFLSRFHSKDPNNQTGYKNSQVDKYLERLQQAELDKKERRKLIRATVALLEQDVAILPLYQYQKEKSTDSTR